MWGMISFMNLMLLEMVMSILMSIELLMNSVLWMCVLGMFREWVMLVLVVKVFNYLENVIMSMVIIIVIRVVIYRLF